MFFKIVLGVSFFTVQLALSIRFYEDSLAMLKSIAQNPFVHIAKKVLMKGAQKL